MSAGFVSGNERHSSNKRTAGPMSEDSKSLITKLITKVLPSNEVP